MIGTIIGVIIGFVVGILGGFVLFSDDYNQKGK